MNTQESNLLKRASEPCFPINATARVRLDGCDIPLFTRCCNISKKSLLVCSRLPVPVGASVNIDISEGRVDFIAIEAKVVEVIKEQEVFFIFLQADF